MTEQWKIWAFQATADDPEYPTTCQWETETAPFQFTECGRTLGPDADFFCDRHDADAADAGLIDSDEFDAQHAHHQALIDAA